MRLNGIRHISLCLLAIFLAWGKGPLGAADAPAGPVKFVPHRVGTYRSEACGVGDFNNDGKLDIVAGAYLYLAPDWKARKIRTLKGEVGNDGKGYLWDFMNIPLDVDSDGDLDLVVTGKWGGPVWFENKLK